MPVSTPTPTSAGLALDSVRLADVPLLASLSAVDLAAVEPSFLRRAYEREDVLFHEGEAPVWLYILVAGQVKLVKHSDDGRDVILHVAMPGDVLGGVSAFGRRPHPFSAVAMSSTVVLRVAGRDFAAIMDAYPAVAKATLDDLIERLTEAHETMKSLAVERVERRVARQLLKLAGRVGQPCGGGHGGNGARVGDAMRLTVPLSRQDVADMAGTTVETAIRVLSRWRRAGLVQDDGEYLVLADVPALRALAQDRAP